MIKGLLLGLVATTSLHAEKRSSILPDFDDGRISFYFENDIFSGTDQDYTNGGRLAWISDKRHSLSNAPPVQRYLSKFSGNVGSHSLFKNIWGFRSSDDVSYQHGMALTQLMFTPTELGAIPPPNERPYAGWLGLGFSIHASNERAINSVEFTIGTSGPHAYGEEVQDFVHGARNIAKFEGWDTQIPNELTINLHFNQTRRFRYLDIDHLGIPFAIDGFTEAAASIGNFRTDVSFGWSMHAGFNLPVNFSDPRLSPTANSISWNADETDPKWSLYFIGGIRGSAVLHDITIDGPISRTYDSPVEREPFVGELYLGIGIHYGDWEFSFIQNTRTREYKEQDGHQEFSSVVFRYHY